MAQIVLAEIEDSIQRLPLDEQLWLISRLAQNLRWKLDTTADKRAQLEAMAADEDIKRELRALDAEFRHTEADGLGAL